MPDPRSRTYTRLRWKGVAPESLSGTSKPSVKLDSSWCAGSLTFHAVTLDLSRCKAGKSGTLGSRTPLLQLLLSLNTYYRSLEPQHRELHSLRGTDSLQPPNP